MPVRAPHFEIIGARPFGFALDLMPTIEDFLHLDGLFFPYEAARRLVGLGPGVTFDLDWDELHLRAFRFQAGRAERRSIRDSVSRQIFASRVSVSRSMPLKPRGSKRWQ